MALSYEQLASRRQIMQSRCLIAVMKFAVYVKGEDSGASNHTNRLAWAVSAINAPDNAAITVLPYILGDTDFLDQDLGLSDTDLQTKVETALVNFIIPAAS